MFKKLFAAMGMGSAEVDTRLHNNRVTPGQTVTGDVYIRGGEVDQEIDSLVLNLMTEVEVESGDTEYKTQHIISRFPLARDFRVRKHEEMVVPFQILIHPETPITEIPSNTQHMSHHPQGGSKGYQPYTYQGHKKTGNRTKDWIYTGLEIDNGIDSKDVDYLQVMPTEPMTRFLAAIENIGFRFYSADVEKGQLRGSGFQSTIGCYQEIEYVPAWGGHFEINEIEVSFVQRPQDTGVLVEIDRRYSSRDGYRSLLIPHHALQSIDWEQEARKLIGVYASHKY